MSAYFADGSPALQRLCQMLERVGVRNVLYAIEKLCRARSQYHYTHDTETGRQWRDLANAIRDFATNLTIPKE